MTGDIKSFLELPTQDRRDVFELAAARLNTSPSYVEKDFWVCLALDALFKPKPDGHPKLLFKGGTSLCKAFGLINRFSEDIDIVVYRDGLGFGEECDPTVAKNISNKRRAAMFDELRAASSEYICGDLRAFLASRINEIAPECRIVKDKLDVDQQTLYVEYSTLFLKHEVSYVAPRVKIEGGARSAVEPNQDCTVTPYISDSLANFSFESGAIRVISPTRTYLEKLLILHGVYCGYRDSGRLPADKDRISRHFYDVAVLTGTDVGGSALTSKDLLNAVRNHNLVAFRQAWKRFDEAVPGSVRLVPQKELQAVIEKDYHAMQSMILGESPDFGWIMNQLRYAEVVINRI
ncbi:MAG: nucleotidyl transferase AbiEii/AbiGii toxin family protein [Acidiferrobacterales bacterium]|nr:nucleotidyl transferase AbiEii/AbiGii toxin family protein [Acidiferrobacterales bacterium]